MHEKLIWKKYSLQIKHELLLVNFFNNAVRIEEIYDN